MNIRRAVYATLTVAVVGVSMFPPVVSAQSRLRGLARFGLEHGGEEVMHFEYSDGSTPEVTAGGGLNLAAGGVLEAFNVRNHSLQAQASLGLKWRTIPEATNQDAHWLRFPLEGLLFYQAPMGLRVGGGTAVHLRNVLSASGDALDERITFQNTPGWLVQAEYPFRNMSVDLRYTAMEYQVEQGGSGTVDASSLGIGFNFFLGRTDRAPVVTKPAE